MPVPVFETACGAPVQHIPPGDPRSLLAFMLRHRCAHLAIRRYWTVGYQPAPIIALFQSLPRRLRSAIRKALEAMRRRDAAIAAAADHTAEEAEEKGGDSVALETDEEWEADEEHGFVRVTFDPATQVLPKAY